MSIAEKITAIAENEKNVYCKFTYKCGICGAEYNNVLDRARCEIECGKKAEEEARKKAEEEATPPPTIKSFKD